MKVRKVFLQGMSKVEGGSHLDFKMQLLDLFLIGAVQLLLPFQVLIQIGVLFVFFEEGIVALLQFHFHIL